jgi:hypothetical protein
MKYIYLIGCLLLFAASCNVLDVEPQSAIPAADAFKDKKGITRGINGAYSGLQALSYYGRSYGIFADLAADNLVHPPNATSVSYAEIDNNSILPENESVDGIWSAIYDGINVANNVIKQVPGIADMTEAEKNAALGELYFIRALNHFNLLNYFGAIPVKTTPTIGVEDINVPRDEVSAVYAAIIADLQFAVANLPAGGSKIRASRHAANALLARVYLYQKDYPNAVRLANDVINSGSYQLMGNFADIFSGEETAESIFEVDFVPLDRNRIAEYNFPLTLNGRREVAPSDDLVSKFTAADKRFAASIAFAGGLPYAIKYDDLSTGSDNVVVLRLAEMYLIRAEATAQQGGDLQQIKDDLNTVRFRANLPGTTATSLLSLLAAIEEERRLEFAFEGQRWFDLVRTGRAVDVLSTVNSVNQTLFPIPLSEILINTNAGMYQNPGY